MLDESKLEPIKQAISGLLEQQKQIQSNLKETLQKFAGAKNLKGDELVAWLGEIYGNTLYEGILIDEGKEHDFEVADKRYSVKARKGFNNGWQTSSIIPKIEGPDGPTHLVFIHFNEDYTIDRIWEFEWAFLIESKRFKPKNVRGLGKGWQFRVRDKADWDFMRLNNRNEGKRMLESWIKKFKEKST